MLAAQDVAQLCKERGITALHIKLRATGGTRSVFYCNSALIHSFHYFRTRTPGPGAASSLRALARSGMKIGRIGKHHCILLSLVNCDCVQKN